MKFSNLNQKVLKTNFKNRLPTFCCKDYGASIKTKFTKIG